MPVTTIPRLCLASLLVLLAAPAVAESPETATAAVPTSWLVRVARMEGASADVETAAQAVHEVASEIAASGRIHSVATLSAQARELQRKVTSARLAARVLDQPLD